MSGVSFSMTLRLVPFKWSLINWRHSYAGRQHVPATVPFPVQTLPELQAQAQPCPGFWDLVCFDKGGLGYQVATCHYWGGS